MRIDIPALLSWKSLLAVILTGALGLAVLNPAGAQANQAPTPQADTATTAEDTAINIAVKANDTDPDGNTLTVAAVGTPAHGTATINGDQTVKYTPAANYHGTDSFTYAVTDGGLVASATVTVTVTSVNDAPVAVADSVQVKQDTAKTFNVLSNDSDVDTGATLTVISASVPAHGTVTLGTGGNVTYTPVTGYVGADSFTYVVSDGSLSATGTVTVTVKAKQTPTPTPDTTFDAKVRAACAVTPAKPGVAGLCSVYLDGDLPTWAQHMIGKNILKLAATEREPKPDRVAEVCSTTTKTAVQRLCLVYADTSLPSFVKERIGKLILAFENGQVREDRDDRGKDHKKDRKDRDDDRDERANTSGQQSVVDRGDDDDDDRAESKKKDKKDRKDRDGDSRRGWGHHKHHR